MIPPCFYIHIFPSSLWSLTISNSSISDHLASRFSTSPTNGPRLLSQAKVGTHSAFRERSHTRAHTAKQGCFGWGVVSLPSTRTARSRTSPGRVPERRTLPLLGLGWMYSRRTQRAFGAAMRLCASLLRGVAAPLGCVIFLFLTKLRFSHPVLRAFRVCEARGGITTLGALCVFSKRRTAACQKG